VWDRVITEFEKRHHTCLKAMMMPYAENDWKGKAELLWYLLDWCRQEAQRVTHGEGPRKG
jgi:hypothetical protein